MKTRTAKNKRERTAWFILRLKNILFPLQPEVLFIHLDCFQRGIGSCRALKICQPFPKQSGAMPTFHSRYLKQNQFIRKKIESSVGFYKATSPLTLDNLLFSCLWYLNLDCVKLYIIVIVINMDTCQLYQQGDYSQVTWMLCRHVGWKYRHIPTSVGEEKSNRSNRSQKCFWAVGRLKISAGKTHFLVVNELTSLPLHFCQTLLLFLSILVQKYVCLCGAFSPECNTYNTDNCDFKKE